MQRRRSRSQRTRLGRILLRAKGQPRAMNRALSCRWQHAAMYLRVPRVAPTSRAATSSLARERLASPHLSVPHPTSPHLTSSHPTPSSPSSSPSPLPHLTSPHLVSYRLVLSRLVSPRLAAARTQATCFCGVRASSRDGLPSPLFAHTRVHISSST